MRQSHLPLEIFFLYRVTPADTQRRKKTSGRERAATRKRERESARARERERARVAQIREVRLAACQARSKDVQGVGHRALVHLDTAVYLGFGTRV